MTRNVVAASEPAAQPSPAAQRQPAPALRAGGDGALRELCRQMEGVFLGILMRQMRQTVWESDLLPRGAGEDTFRALYELELGDRLAHAATGMRSGFGIADALYNQLQALDIQAAGFQDLTV